MHHEKLLDVKSNFDCSFFKVKSDSIFYRFAGQYFGLEF